MSTTGNLVLPLAAAPIAVQSPLPVNHQRRLAENLLLRQSAADRSAKEVLFDSLLGDAGQIHSIGQTTLARNTKAQDAVLAARHGYFLLVFSAGHVLTPAGSRNDYLGLRAEPVVRKFVLRSPAPALVS